MMPRNCSVTTTWANQVVRRRSGHRRTLSSKNVQNSGYRAIKRNVSSPELTTLGMISLSAVAVSPFMLSEQNVLQKHPQSTKIQSHAKLRHSGSLKELSDLYVPTDRVTMFTGKEIVEESKKLEAEIDEMMLRLGETQKGDGKL